MSNSPTKGGSRPTRPKAALGSLPVQGPVRGHGPVAPPPPPPPPPVTFDLIISSMTVKNPRSLFNDTDYATLAINVLAADNTVIKQYGPVVRSLGNLGKGASIDPGMSITGMLIPEGGSLAVSFLVVNKGGWDWDSSTINALELAGSAVMGALVQGTIVAPATTTAATATVAATTTTTATVTLPWAIAITAAIIGLLEAINILFADCDGTVVPGVLSLGQTEILEYAAPGEWQIIYDYPGSDSPVGCGANSDYSVTYTIQPTPPPIPLVKVPNIVGRTILAAQMALGAVDLVGMERYVKTVNAAPGIIIGQSPAAGAVIPEQSIVTYDVQAPGVTPA